MSAAPDLIQAIKDDSLELASRVLSINFKPSGSGYVALCPLPNHAEKTPSCHYDPTRRSFKCFGCGWSGDIFDLYTAVNGGEFPDAVAALGGGMPNGSTRGRRPHGFENLDRKSADKVPTSGAPHGMPEPAYNPNRVARFLYHDAEGRIVGGADRINGTAGKHFSQWRHNGRGGWEPKGAVLPPLYGLPELLRRKDDPILVCEGEKAVEAAKRHFPDFAYTTSLAGSGNASRSDWSPIEGREVYLWPDRDEPGAKYAREVARIAARLGVTVRVVEVPSDWPEHWDLADEFPDGVTDDDLRRMLREAKPLGEDAEAAASDHWPRPEPLSDASRVPCLLDDSGFGGSWLAVAFPSRLSSYVGSVAASAELSCESVVVGCLPSAALAIGPDVLGRGNRDHCETLSLWCMSVEPPGSRKSGAIAEATAPLRPIDDQLREQSRVVRSDWRSRESLRAKEFSALEKKLGDHFDSDPGTKKFLKGFALEHIRERLAAIERERLEDPDPGRFELWSSNATPEAVVERVAASRCYGAISAEGATIIEGLAEYREGNDGAPVGYWCSFYTGDAVSVARKGKDALVIAEKSAILCCGITIQPDVLARARSKPALARRGFLARFLKFAPGRRAEVRENPPPKDMEAVAWWHGAIARIANARPSAQVEVSCSSAAASQLRTFEVEMRRRANNDDDLGASPAVAEWACKAHGLALRIAVVFHALEGHTYSTPIAAETMTRAILLVRFGLSVEIALADGDGRPDHSKLHRLLRRITASGLAAITPRIVAHNNWCGMRTEEAYSLLRELADYGYVREQLRKPSTGRPSTVFLVHPRLREQKPSDGTDKTDKTFNDDDKSSVSSVSSGPTEETQGDDDGGEL